MTTVFLLQVIVFSSKQQRIIATERQNSALTGAKHFNEPYMPVLAIEDAR